MQKRKLSTATLLTVFLFSTFIPLFPGFPVAKAQNEWYKISGSGTSLVVILYLPIGGGGGTNATAVFYQGSLSATNSTFSEDWHWMGESPSFGFLWTEMPAGESTTQKGRGWLSVVYNDSDVLILQRERNTTTPYHNHIITQYTFWADKDYFAYEVYLGRWGSGLSVINQPQIGVYPYTGGVSYTKWNMGYNGTPIQGLSAIQVTPELMKNQSSFYWQTVSEIGGAGRVTGFILTYANPPNMIASTSGVTSATNGEIQYMHMWSNANDDFNAPVIVSTKEFYSSYIVYFYLHGTDPVYKKTADLAKQLWQEQHSSAVSWGDWDGYSFAYEWGKAIGNRVGAFYWAGTEPNKGAFLFKNTTTWGTGTNNTDSWAMTMAADLSHNYPNVALQNDTSTYYVSSYDETYKDRSSSMTSTSNSEIWVRWRSNAGAIDWDNYWYTWGSSDKFNTTTYFTPRYNGGITKAWTAWRTQGQAGATMEFTQITANVTADYTMYDPFSNEYVGILVKAGEGTAANVIMNSTGVFVFYINNDSQQSYTTSDVKYQKLTFWLHYGQITSEGQITGYFTSPTLADKVWYPPLHPVNSNLFSVAQTGDFYNGTATFPKMTYIDKSHYNLTSLSSGQKTFTLFLNTTIFANISDVVGADSFNYNNQSGNLTFTATYGASPLELQLVTRALSVTINNPQNTTYTTSSIPIDLMLSGNGTGQMVSWNLKFSNGTWLYLTNQTSTSGTATINQNATSCLFAVLATDNEGSIDYAEVTFSVSIITAGDTYYTTVTINNPQNITYTSSSISVNLSLYGNGTGQAVSWNAKFSNGTWLYGSNQTSTSTTMAINENQTSVLFAVLATDNGGSSDYAEAYFSVTIITTPDTYYISVTAVSPLHKTYTTASISVSLTLAGNGTGQTVSWNVKFSNGTWLYAQNQTSTSMLIKISTNETNCAFAVLASDNEGSNDYAEIYFSIYFSVSPSQTLSSPWFAVTAVFVITGVGASAYWFYRKSEKSKTKTAGE